MKSIKRVENLPQGVREIGGGGGGTQSTTMS